MVCVLCFLEPDIRKTELGTASQRNNIMSQNFSKNQRKWEESGALLRKLPRFHKAGYTGNSKS